MRQKAHSRPAKAPPSPPWAKEVGQPTTFYHEGGHGQNYWARGWRYGIIREVPIKGQHKGWVRVEVPVKLYGWNDDKTKGKVGWCLRAFEKAWVREGNVNEPGDYVYHGPRLKEIVKERQEEKAEQQTKADKRKRKG
jgi:hypothetical protein